MKDTSDKELKITEERVKAAAEGEGLAASLALGLLHGLSETADRQQTILNHLLEERDGRRTESN